MPETFVTKSTVSEIIVVNQLDNMKSDDNFASRLTSLFKQWEVTHGQRLSNRELARRLATIGQPMSSAYLSQLRRGIRTKPSNSVVSRLAEFFDTSPEYLQFGVGDTSTPDIDKINKIADPGLRRLLSAADGLSDHTVQLLITIAGKLQSTGTCQPDHTVSNTLTDQNISTPQSQNSTQSGSGHIHPSHPKWQTVLKEPRPTLDPTEPSFDYEFR
ncbi:helix-turn-helix domain-containing protein [Nocardia brasiliensis]